MKNALPLIVAVNLLLFTAQNTHATKAMGVTYHTLSFAENKGQLSTEKVLLALYSDVRVFFAEIDEKAKTATVLARPAVTGIDLINILAKHGFKARAITQKTVDEDPFQVEQKAIERNNFLKNNK